MWTKFKFEPLEMTRSGTATFHVEAAGMITTVLKWRHQQTHGPFPLHLVRGMEVFFTILDARDRPVP